MDDYTKNHLMAWVKNHAPIHYTDTDACYQAMVAYCIEHDAVERGWPSVFDGMMDSNHRPVLRGYSTPRPSNFYAEDGTQLYKDGSIL